jgi:hypothetical protein
MSSMISNNIIVTNMLSSLESCVKEAVTNAARMMSEKHGMSWEEEEPVEEEPVEEEPVEEEPVVEEVVEEQNMAETRYQAKHKCHLCKSKDIKIIWFYWRNEKPLEYYSCNKCCCYGKI